MGQINIIITFQHDEALKARQ